MPRAAAALMTSPARRRPPMPPDKKGDYAVGYGKPPRHTRFTRGQSGNPRGRAPGAKNMKTLLSEALNECVIVTENGGPREGNTRATYLKHDGRPTAPTPRPVLARSRPPPPQSTH